MSAAGRVLQPFQGSYLTPAYEHATVGDAMHPGVIECPTDATLVDVARTMAGQHVHCVVVPRTDGGWSMVSDLDVLRAADAAAEVTAAAVGREPAVVTARQPLREAARLMGERGEAHLLVAGDDGKPVGVLSSLDVAGIVAWGRA